MKKKEIIALVAVIVAAVVMISIGSYAYFTAKVTGTSQANTITSGTMAITYADGPSITLDNAIPGDTVIKTFTVTNTGNVDSNYDVYLSEVNNGFADQTDLAYSLVSTDGGYSTTSDIQVPSAATKIVSAQAITASATHTYTLTIKFLNKTTNQDINQGKKFSAKLQVNEYKNYVNLTKNLAHDLTEIQGGTSAIAAKTAPDFTNNATTDEGMFATTDDYGTSYYYRGAVTNNNILFGGFCWKVIRINGNGTTRMIYNGTPTNGTCVATGTATEISQSAFNTNYNDNAYVGYMYGTTGATTYEATHANTNSSTAKIAIDTWYKTNLSSYASKISDTEFCNDRSIASTAATWLPSDTAKGYGTNETYYGAYNRRFNTHVPELTCQNKNDRFTVSDKINGNGNLTNPVGLITMDEVGFAGASMSSWNSNSSYYLYTNSFYWTMSSSRFNGSVACEFSVTSGGYIDSFVVSSAIGVRPVINLKTDTLYTSGDGTSSSPYIIS
jgi:hypothetical protein